MLCLQIIHKGLLLETPFTFSTFPGLNNNYDISVKKEKSLLIAKSAKTSVQTTIPTIRRSSVILQNSSLNKHNCYIILCINNVSLFVKVTDHSKIQFFSWVSPISTRLFCCITCTFKRSSLWLFRFTTKFVPFLQISINIADF